MHDKRAQMGQSPMSLADMARSMGATAEAAKREPRIASVLRELEVECEELHSVISTLESRLHPACQPEAPGAGGAEGRIASCEIEGILNARAGSVGSARARLRSLLDRLEI